MLLSWMASLEFTAVLLPKPITHLLGKFGPAGPRLQNEMVLLLFPAPVLVWNRTFAVAVALLPVVDPRIEQFVTRSFWAPFTNRMVLVGAIADVLVFEKVSELSPSS